MWVNESFTVSVSPPIRHDKYLENNSGHLSTSAVKFPVFWDRKSYTLTYMRKYHIWGERCCLRLDCKPRHHMPDDLNLHQHSCEDLKCRTVSVLVRCRVRVNFMFVIPCIIIQGGSNMTGTDFCVNKPHCAAAVRPWESEATTSTLPPARVITCSVLSGSC